MSFVCQDPDQRAANATLPPRLSPSHPSVNATDGDDIDVHPEHPTRHIHHKANSIGSGHTSEDQVFFQDVISAIGTASAILVTGPANAKTELIKHIHRHNPQLIEPIAAVETDHPSDGAFIAHARRYFRALNRTPSIRGLVASLGDGWKQAGLKGTSPSRCELTQRTACAAAPMIGACPDS